MFDTVFFLTTAPDEQATLSARIPYIPVVGDIFDFRTSEETVLSDKFRVVSVEKVLTGGAVDLSSPQFPVGTLYVRVEIETAWVQDSPE